VLAAAGEFGHPEDPLFIIPHGDVYDGVGGTLVH
jgi:hypothetical protein